jgi:uncharacterized protein
MTTLSIRRSASVDGRQSAPSFFHVGLVLLGRFLDEATRLTPRLTSTKRRARPNVRGAHQYALARLRRDLPPALHYHALRHTQDDVLSAVERLAALSGITGRSLDLLRTAAMFHDIGYIQTRTEHEAASIAITRAVLPSFGFSPEDITEIVGMIEATKLPQTPHTLSEAILADADLDSLGRVDFFIRSEELHREHTAYGSVTARDDWYEQQHRFLCQHKFHAAVARASRDAQKFRNIAQLARDMRREG